jgi:Peptidase C13 family
MKTDDWTKAYRNIVTDAIGALSRERLRTTNLYLNIKPYEKGSVLGPEFQGIRARQRCLLVFADDDPMANFGHGCRYRFYAEESQSFLYEVPARFPPYLYDQPETVRVFHEPVRLRSTRDGIPLKISTPSPPSVSQERYAILFSGSSNRRHLNDLEYCYRMLIDRYGFKAANVLVLNFDGTLKVGRNLATKWPKQTSPNSTPYRMQIFGKADRSDFKRACQHIAGKLQPGDLLFIHTNGHGDALIADGQIQMPYVVCHDYSRYYAADFCVDLAVFDAHESMLIMMEQCYSGEFISHLIGASSSGQINARLLSVACASSKTSYGTGDGLFDRFALGWITSHLNKDPYGAAPIYLVDENGSGFVEASEAYSYAEKVADPRDKPVYADNPSTAGNPSAASTSNTASASNAATTPTAAGIRLG